MPRILLLTVDRLVAQLLAVPSLAKSKADCRVVRTLEELSATLGSGKGGASILLSFGTGVIVPKATLDRFDGRCYNVHCASPQYPGRDPHHFAAYDGVIDYGATAHVMEARVDTGAIVDVELVRMEPGAAAKDYLDAAEEAGLVVLDRLAARLLAGELINPMAVSWGRPKTTRRDFERLCLISPVEHRDEFERRRRAAAMGDFRNLYVELHGYRFRVEGPAASQQPERWFDFTEAAYGKLLDAAKSSYQFATYRHAVEGRHVLWRHDVEFSVESALSLAAMEHERGLVATYFFGLDRPYYNLFEPEIRHRAREIIRLGHRAGLRFDAAGGLDQRESREGLTARIDQERRILQELLGVQIDALSVHAAGTADVAQLREREIAGLINADSDYLNEGYGCCSDGHGYWLSASIYDVILNGGRERLQVTTHPVFWSAQPCAPRSRIERTVLGRARRALQEYDRQLPAASRRHVI